MVESLIPPLGYRRRYSANGISKKMVVDNKKTKVFRFSLQALFFITMLTAVLTATYIWLNKEPRHIYTSFCSNYPQPVTQKEVEQELAEADGDWITIRGASHTPNNTANIWISEDIIIAVPDRTGWPNRPPHCNTVLVTGLLVYEGKQYKMYRTIFEWD